MKRPNLSYNHYFPFYTQKITGKKKYCHAVDTVMYISYNEGIMIRLVYKRMKIYEVSIERIQQSELPNYRMNADYISYVDFAKEVEKLYRILSKALGNLGDEPAYIKTLIFPSYFKYGNSIEFEIKHRNIHIRFEEQDFEIEAGKKIQKEKPSNYTSSKEDARKKIISDAIEKINSQTTYMEIDNNEFEKRLDNEWEYFIQYFQSPKFIRKTGYEPR